MESPESGEIMVIQVQRSVAFSLVRVYFFCSTFHFVFSKLSFVYFFRVCQVFQVKWVSLVILELW